ncbi:MAG TPA: Geranylgeranyl diphosphate synthase [Hyphomicrobiaceae bacterium MAG_BT-2024]
MSELEDDVAILTALLSIDFQSTSLFDDMIIELSSQMYICASGSSITTDILHEAMNYSLGLRGKYARGLLVLLVMTGWNKPWRSAIYCAKAVEMVHTASLIIDDLPSMDNASLRRGKATNHTKFGEPISILTAISLLSEAFKLLASCPELNAEQRHLAVTCLASSIGLNGMSSGQMRDLVSLKTEIADIELTHALKTGTLFAKAAELGCIAANVSGEQKWLLSDFGMQLGKAFQELDDIIDVATVSKSTGKDTSKDTSKPTIVAILGIKKAEQRAIKQVAKALDCLKSSTAKKSHLRQFTLNLTRAMLAMIHSLED